MLPRESRDALRFGLSRVQDQYGAGIAQCVFEMAPLQFIPSKLQQVGKRRIPAVHERIDSSLNSLAGGLGLKKEEVIERMQGVGISDGRRAESLSIEEFQVLTKAFL